MFGRKSEEEKAAEAAAKVEADAKVKTIELERKSAAAKEAAEAAKEAAEVEAKKAAEAEAKKAAEVAEAAKKKTDYINEKSKLTEKELLAELLWNLSRVENSPTIDTEDYQKMMLKYQDGLETKIMRMDRYLEQIYDKLYEINIGVRADRISEPY